MEKNGREESEGGSGSEGTNSCNPEIDDEDAENDLELNDLEEEEGWNNDRACSTLFSIFADSAAREDKAPPPPCFDEEEAFDADFLSLSRSGPRAGEEE